jgi:hypothetical protein
MASIGFGGDPESFMEAPRMENKGLAETFGGGSFIASLLDLVGIHRQVAKGPKPSKAEQTSQDAIPTPSVPQVLTDIESILTPQETPIVPMTENAPLTTWGRNWIQSLQPLTKIDPNDAR